MVFASGTFLFVFLPVALAGYWLLRNRTVNVLNGFLLAMSIVFYLNSGVRQFILLMASVCANYIFALLVSENVQKRTLKKIFLALAIVHNIGMLFIFKYLTFIRVETLRIAGVDTGHVINIALPLGISFYTFQALSYVIDVYRDNELVEKNIFNVALYISFFPQLIAGPIVRWDSIRDDLRTRPWKFERGGVDHGLQRFTIGLGKKVIIANQMAIFADKAFALQTSGDLTTGFAWMGAIAYTLQIYYDFSGYSDMAIGLGYIFGFRFPENFRHPYISSSITEFWRRWHISLSSWFRDYVYIPLGGNRCSKGRNFINLFIVWGLTGIWHGADYTFWLWGFCYFFILVVEKLAGKRLTDSPLKKSMGHIYTLFVVILLWVIFRADSVSMAVSYIRTMFGCNSADSVYAIGVTGLYFRNMIGYGMIAVMGCVPWNRLIERIELKISKHNFGVIKTVWILAVFIIACCITLDGDYNPFVYFNF